MTWIPPSDWTRITTKAPLAGLRNRSSLASREKGRSICLHSVPKRGEERGQLANVIDVKMTGEQMSHLLARQAVSSKCVHGARSTVDHHASVRQFYEVVGGVPLAAWNDGA
jgi:hypothetical protein